MEDKEIIQLFWRRSEQAIKEVSCKYGKLIFHISNGILNNKEDASECVNDTYLGLWDSIPPHRPEPFLAYVCRIARNIALTKYRSNTAQKRNSSYDISIEELRDCLSSPSIDEILTAKELGQEINHFLDTLDSRNRIIFMRRYWFSDSIEEIASRFDMSENNVSVKLYRIRTHLKKHLIKEGLLHE